MRPKVILTLTQLALLIAATTQLEAQSKGSESSPINYYPLSSLIAARSLGKTVEEMEAMYSPSAKDYISLLNEKKKDQSFGANGGPYFPYEPDRGYIDIYDENNSMWYWHFKAQKNPDTAPLVVWLAGGPGGASTLAVFFANGPFKLHNWPKGGEKATLNPNSWNLEANMLYPDFPLGCGFSTVTREGLSLVGKQAQEQFAIFLTKFLAKYPQYKKRPLYFSGVSYAGHWVPYVVDALRNLNNPDINLKGFYVSDGLIDATAMEKSYFKFGLEYSNYTKLTQEDVQALTPLQELCLYSISTGKNRLHVRKTFNLCWTTFYMGALMKTIRKKNPYFFDEYMPGLTKIPHFDGEFYAFLNNPSVQNYLGVRVHKFQTLNQTFYKEFGQNDIFVNMKPYYVKLLNAGLKVVILCGVDDYITNYLMSETVTAETGWKYQNQFNAVQRAPCKYGLCKEYENLREIRVKDSGHGTSLFQPGFALEIITKLISGGSE